MPITLAGAKAGDVLLLTRPIGSGVILAAHMAGKAPPRVLAQALARMEQPQDVAARILSDAHAMTDVTGFGLCGHVAAICAASGVGAQIGAASVPVYEGARALSNAGIASSLLQANMDDTPTLGSNDPLLHDPQTAGGLLAVLPKDAAEAALDRLKAEGAEGWIIGEITAATGPIRIV